jgi:hypothetical protein
VSDLDALDLTDDERRFLAMHARYEAESQLDARRYVIGMNDDGTVKLGLTVEGREARRDRWQAIANALHPDGGRA